MARRLLAPLARRRHGLGACAVLHRQAAHGASVDPPAAGFRRRRLRDRRHRPWCFAVGPESFDNNPALAGIIGAVSAAIAAGAAWLHWKKFRVPITVAAGAASVAGIAVGLLVAALGENADLART